MKTVTPMVRRDHTNQVDYCLKVSSIGVYLLDNNGFHLDHQEV